MPYERVNRVPSAASASNVGACPATSSGLLFSKITTTTWSGGAAVAVAVGAEVPVAGPGGVGAGTGAAGPQAASIAVAARSATRERVPANRTTSRGADARVRAVVGLV